MNQATTETNISEEENTEIDFGAEAAEEHRRTPGEYIDKALHLLGSQLKSAAGLVKE